MIEEFSSKSWRDFSQRYRGTYGWYMAEDNKKILVRVSDVGEGTVTFNDASDFPYKGIADKGNFFEFLPVQRGVYNLPEDLVLCYRKSERQWRRGLCRENTVIHSVNSGRTLDIGFDLLVDLFNPKQTTLDYIEAFLAGARSYVGLNSMFSISSNNYLLVYDKMIGKYTPKERTITITDSLYAQEIRDTVRDLMLPFTIIEEKK